MILLRHLKYEAIIVNTPHIFFLPLMRFLVGILNILHIRYKLYTLRICLRSKTKTHYAIETQNHSTKSEFVIVYLKKNGLLGLFET